MEAKCPFAMLVTAHQTTRCQNR